MMEDYSKKAIFTLAQSKPEESKAVVTSGPTTYNECNNQLGTCTGMMRIIQALCALSNMMA